MDDYARPHRADIVEDYLRVKGLRVWRGQHIRLTLIPLKIFGMLSAVLCLHVSHLQPLFIELKTALQEEWRLLNSAVVDHLVENMVRRYHDFPQENMAEDRGAKSADFSDRKVIRPRITDSQSHNTVSKSSVENGVTESLSQQ
ncbi:hypothetical protein TNCV_409621 [Trichonephila clavipes]|nr:hypothetical protein TNCV_409621 [Trichonephila clavipes]